MPINIFAQALFLASAGRSAEFPAGGPREIAFAGRSNVGKSSAINALAGRKRLAFTSKTPGRTQTINFYSIGEEARLVDLPGYGYARAPQTERSKWEHLVSSYLEERRNLAGVVVVMDARHPLTPLDLGLLEWLAPLELRTLALLTKIDKLSRVEQSAALSMTRRTVPEAMLYSSVTKAGVDAVRERLLQWLLEAPSRGAE